MANWGRTNIHKDCENLVKHLLNYTYSYQLINLNVGTSNFPGLDLGDTATGVAYQVSAEKGSNKVDDTLDKVLRFKHYLKFPKIRVFMLLGKQNTYSLNAVTGLFFSFDKKSDIVDFNDLLRHMQELRSSQLQKILDLLEEELPYTLKKLQGEPAVTPTARISLIDVNETLAATSLRYYQHSIIRLRLMGQAFSVPVLYQALSRFYEGNRKSCLYLFRDEYRRSNTTRQMDYYEKPQIGHADQYAKEGRLQLLPNEITIEFASYAAEELQLTMLNNEVRGVISMLLFCQRLYGAKPMQVELDFELGSNGKLAFFSQNSELKVGGVYSSPILDPSPHAFSKVVLDTTNPTLNAVLSDVIHGFVTEGQPGYFPSPPFMELNETEQNRQNEWYRSFFALPLQDLDN